MGVETGSLVTLDVDRPVAGGWMLSRHDGQVVFVVGAIPGERVVARVTRLARGTAYAEAIDVETPSADRRPGVEGRCGGTLYAHISYARQVALKAQIIEDAWRRLARQSPPAPVSVVPSLERGYRTRARLHAEGARLGFYRDGTHTVCDAAATGQLSSDTVAWLEQVQAGMARLGPSGLVGLELAESLSGDARVCHLEFAHAPHVDAWQAILAGVSGASWDGPGATAEGRPLLGEPFVWDELPLIGTDGATMLRLRHHVRSFFQGNRFLVGRLADMVARGVAGGPALDLYAGTGLLGLSVAAVRALPVTLVEGDRWSSRDLAANVPEGSPGLRVEASSVEAYVSRRRRGFATWIVDPPRQGLSANVRLAVLRDRPSRLVYVSCDVATLARDVAAMTTGGYEVRSLVGLDLFPSTAHVEAVCVLDAPGRP